ncbi:MAG: LysE family translocator [Thermodesulfobacteriota bacterium]|nr:LysE family translocator [Thermodesulfobacteriota bacterium]
MTIESAIAFFLALLVWVIIPGPAIFAIVGRSLTTGLKSALKLIAGILLGDLFYISIVLFGMAAIGNILGDLFFIIRMVGASYLVFLGLRLWFKDSKFKYSVPTGEKPDRYKSLLAGFSITLGNPKAILFHMGFLPTFFNLTVISVLDAFLIILIFMTVLGSSLTIYAYSASKARLFFRDQRKIRILNRSAGAILIGAGIAVATKK